MVSGAGETVTNMVFGATSDVIGALITQIAGIGATLPVATSVTVPFVLNTAYSLTEVVDISTSGPTSTSIDASFQALIPEPSTITLVTLGLMGAFAIRRKK